MPQASEPGWDGLHSVADAANAVDLADDLVAVLEPERRLAEAADAAWRAGEDEVARLDCDEARDVGDDVIRLEDELARARLLHARPIEQAADACVYIRV